MRKRILITGGAGLIGSNLVRFLRDHSDSEIFVVDNLWRGKKENLVENGIQIIPFENNFFELDLR